MAEGSENRDNIESPESRLVRYLNKHGYPKLKNLDLEIVLAEHGTDEDAKMVSEAITDADVLALESPFWKPEYKTKMQNSADGISEPEGLMPGDPDDIFFLGLSKRFHGSRVRIALPEVPKGSKMEDKIRDPIGMWLSVMRWLTDRKFPERATAREAIKTAIEHAAVGNALRERFIAKNFGPELCRALKGDQRFQEADSIVVKMFMGAAHTSLVPRLRKIHPNAKLNILKRPFINTYNSEAIRRMLYGRKISEELYDDALMENIISYVGLRPPEKFPSGDSGKALMMRILIPQLTNDEREKLYKAAMRDQKEARDLFTSTMDQKDISVPSELERFLNLE